MFGFLIDIFLIIILVYLQMLILDVVLEIFVIKIQIIVGTFRKFCLSVGILKIRDIKFHFRRTNLLFRLKIILNGKMIREVESTLMMFIAEKRGYLQIKNC